MCISASYPRVDLAQNKSRNSYLFVRKAQVIMKADRLNRLVVSWRDMGNHTLGIAHTASQPSPAQAILAWFCKTTLNQDNLDFDRARNG